MSTKDNVTVRPCHEFPAKPTYAERASNSGDPGEAAKQERTCDQVFDTFIRHCEMRVAHKDMAFSTLEGYRKILNRTWRPALGDREFKSAVYSELVAIAAAQQWQTNEDVQQRN